MERKYFDINEDAAKLAHEMMPFRDYEAGSKTAEYKGYCDKAYDLADEVAKKHPEEAEKAYGIAERYAKRMAYNMNQSSRIGAMCPSVMISGAGNFPVKKKERQNAADDRNRAEWNEIQKLLDKIRKLGTGKAAIMSGDADALEKLEKKLAGLKDNQERMKAANRAIRMKDTEKGDAKLAEMGYSKKAIEALRTPDFCGRIGYADYTLKNNNANIHRIEGRIRTLKAEKEREPQEQEDQSNDLFRVVENAEIMRLQLFFDDKPEPEVRDVLKKNGFRWSLSNTCWQRTLNENGRYALKRVRQALEV